MHELAVLGGSSRYRAVESRQQMVEVLREISSGVIDCSFELRTRPLDPAHLRVLLDDVALPRATDHGWGIAGTTVTLHGAACTALRDGAAHRVSLQLECEHPVLGP